MQAVLYGNWGQFHKTVYDVILSYVVRSAMSLHCIYELCTTKYSGPRSCIDRQKKKEEISFEKDLSVLYY